MRILVACEYSGTVREAFSKLGHEAWSCDLEDTDDPGNHYQGDVFDILYEDWDLLVAHPPCTYLSNAGARHLWKGGELNQERYAKGLIAKEFFMKLLNAEHIPQRAIENPIQSKIYELPPHTQTIQPYDF